MSTLKTTNIQHPSAASPAIELTAAGGLWLGGGKILQVVRATDGTARSTTSTTFVDITGMTVTITPTKSTSAIVILYSSFVQAASAQQLVIQITDASNNAISGGEGAYIYNNVGSLQSQLTMLAYDTPATTSATTYKARFKITGGTAQISNDLITGQMYAIEVSA